MAHEDLRVHPPPGDGSPRTSLIRIATQVVSVPSPVIGEGGRLFDRTSRRVRLTPAGKRRLAESLDPYHQLQTAFARAHQAATGVAGTLRIWFHAVSAGPLMPAIVQTFQTRHPECQLEFVNTGHDRSYVEVLKSREVDMLATRLPLTDPQITIGPILSREERVAVLAKNDTLAVRESISYEELAERAVSDMPGFPREMMDAYTPPVTPSGRVLKRVVHEGSEDLLMRVALGEQVHATVPSFLDHYSHPGVTSVPIRDLPPPETALAWLAANRSAKIAAFVRAATDVLTQTDLAT